MNKRSIIVYKMAWAKCTLMAIGGALGSWTTAMDGVIWTNLNGTEKIKVIFGSLGVAIFVVVAFLDRTINKIEGEQQQIPGTPEHVAAQKTSKPE